MTAAAILLRDAEAALRLAAAGELSLLESAFVAWLRAEPAPSFVTDVLSTPYVLAPAPASRALG